MASTTFVDQQTVVLAAWLNDVNSWTYKGTATFAKMTYSQIGLTPVTLASSLNQGTGTANNYLSIDIQNQSNGTAASTDFVATADTGTDTTNYVNLGINNSGYSQAGWTLNGALDGYVYAQSGNLAIGTAAAKRLDLFTGGTLAANVAMSISGAGAITYPSATAITLPSITTATTQATSDSSTKLATTAFVKTTFPSVLNTPVQAFLGADVLLNNTGTYFSGPNTGSIGANGQVWLILATACCTDTAGTARFHVQIANNGALATIETSEVSSAANSEVAISLSFLATLTGATTFTLKANDSTATSGKLLTSAPSGAVANVATSITAVRLS